LLPEAIEFGHGSLLAPSNVRNHQRALLLRASGALRG
jgi:hypothetical protein